MSLLVSELAQIIDRVTVIAPSNLRLHDFFESMAYELTTGLGQEQILDLQLAAPAEGPIRSWASFTLGRRGGLDVRLSMMGTSLEVERLSPLTLEISDAFLLWLPPDDPKTDLIFSYPFSEELEFKPAVVVGIGEQWNDTEHRLRAKALAAWAQRRFKRLHFTSQSQTFLSDALEWVLSF